MAKRKRTIVQTTIYKTLHIASQGVNLLLFIMKVRTNLKTALFSSPIRLTAPKISKFREIVSKISKSDKSNGCLNVVHR